MWQTNIAMNIYKISNFFTNPSTGQDPIPLQLQMNKTSYQILILDFRYLSSTLNPYPQQQHSTSCVLHKIPNTLTAFLFNISHKHPVLKMRSLLSKAHFFLFWIFFITWLCLPFIHIKLTCKLNKICFQEICFWLLYYRLSMIVIIFTLVFFSTSSTPAVPSFLCCVSGR